VWSNQTIKLVFVASPLRMQHSGKKAKMGWLEIMIICPSGASDAVILENLIFLDIFILPILLFCKYVGLNYLHVYDKCVNKLSTAKIINAWNLLNSNFSVLISSCNFDVEKYSLCLCTL
jgi:hypothetical protein